MNEQLAKRGESVALTQRSRDIPSGFDIVVGIARQVWRNEPTAASHESLLMLNMPGSTGRKTLADGYEQETAVIDQNERPQFPDRANDRIGEWLAGLTHG